MILLLSFVDCLFFTPPVRIEKWVFISQNRKKRPWDLHVCNAVEVSAYLLAALENVQVCCEVTDHLEEEE